MENEALAAPVFLPQAQALATQVIELSQQDLADWQQVMIGEVVGTAVAARTFAGTLGDLQLDNIIDLMRRFWEVIDRF